MTTILICPECRWEVGACPTCGRLQCHCTEAGVYIHWPSAKIHPRPPYRKILRRNLEEMRAREKEMLRVVSTSFRDRVYQASASDDGSGSVAPVTRSHRGGPQMHAPGRDTLPSEGVGPKFYTRPPDVAGGERDVLENEGADAAPPDHAELVAIGAG